MYWCNCKVTSTRKKGWVVRTVTVMRVTEVDGDGICTTCGHYAMFSRTKSLTPQGETHGKAKLMERDVREIRMLLREGWRSYEIAEKFDVNVRTISLIKRNISWQHVKDL